MRASRGPFHRQRGVSGVVAIIEFVLGLAVASTGTGATLVSVPHTPASNCSASVFSMHNLSGLQLQGHDWMSSGDSSEAGCLAACCALSNCTGWNYHVASTIPTHHPKQCWLSAAPRLYATAAEVTDTWVGGARVHVTCPAHANPDHSCTPATPQCDGSNYTRCREELVRSVFNTTTGRLPSRDTPDHIEDWSNWSMHGVPGPGQGTGIGDVEWTMGLQKLIWTIGLPGNGMRQGMLRLNSTVWYSRNTSGDAPSNSPPVGYGVPAGDSPHCPTPDRPGYESWVGMSDTLVIHHNGHQPCSGGDPPRTTKCTDCTPNYDTSLDWFVTRTDAAYTCAPWRTLFFFLECGCARWYAQKHTNMHAARCTQTTHTTAVQPQSGKPDRVIS